VAKRHPDALVIGADTLVSLRSRIYGKPRDRREAAEMLESLSGHTHRVVTGVCLVHLRSHHQQVFSETSFVTFHPMSPGRIQEYLERVDPLDKAGAYAIQERGELIIENIIGSFTNVVGLPLARLREELLMWA
jgi:septum formation protein